uniref:Uncharacterized protein n=1 Tax=Panagrolaimus sp. JU765 TaxID=591449 RepID=A0AC34RBZ8_9BILA
MQTTCFDVLVKPEGVQTTGGSVLNAECTWDAGTDDKLEISVDLPPGYTLQLVGAQIWTDAPPPVKTTETWVWAVAGVGVVIGLAMIIGGIVAFIKCRNKKAQQQQEILTEVKVDPSSARSKDLKKKKKKEEAPNPEGSKEIPSQVSSYKKPDEMPSGIQKMMTKVQKRIKFDVKKQKTLKVTLDEDEDGQTPAKNENGAEESKEPMKNEEKTAEKKEMEAPPPKNDVAQTKEKEKEIKQKEEKARQIQRKMIQEQRMRSERAQKLKTEKEKENLRTNETQEAEDDGAADDGRPQRTADTQKSSDDEKGAESNQN